MQLKSYSLLPLLFAVLFLFPQSVQAQSFAPADGIPSAESAAFVEGPIAYWRNGAIVLTQSKFQDIDQGGVRCGSTEGGYSTENSFYRVFDLSEYPEITDGFTVMEVGAGIAISTTGWPESTPTQTGAIRIYTLANAPSGGEFAIDDLSLVSETEFDIDGPAGAFYLQTVEIDGAFSSSDLLAVEMFLPTGDPTVNTDLLEPFSVSQGGNDAGVTGNEYLASESCGITNPTDITTLGEFNSEWVVTVTGVSGAVANEDGAAAQRVTLGQAYPNPVVGRTAIPFSLDTAQRVRIAVYDALGRAVAVAADRAFGAGEQVVEVSVAGLPSGLYFYRIDAGAQTLTRKLVVLQ